ELYSRRCAANLRWLIPELQNQRRKSGGHQALLQLFGRAAGRTVCRTGKHWVPGDLSQQGLCRSACGRKPGQRSESGDWRLTHKNAPLDSIFVECDAWASFKSLAEPVPTLANGDLHRAQNEQDWLC